MIGLSKLSTFFTVNYLRFLWWQTLIIYILFFDSVITEMEKEGSKLFG